MGNKTHKSILYILFILMVFLVTIFTFISIQANNLAKNGDRMLQRNKEMTTEYISSIVSGSYMSAKISTSRIIDRIETRVEYEYTDDEEFEKDFIKLTNMIAPHDINNLEVIFVKSIKDIFLFDIKSNAMDPFGIIISNTVSDLSQRGFIFSDLSPDCAKFGMSRVFKDEISQQYNKILVVDALDMILNRKVPTLSLSTIIGWQFRTPTNESFRIDKFTMENLMELYFKNNRDYKIFKSFEFLYPAYMYWDNDMIGRPIIKKGNFSKDSRQIVMVQGFNLTEIISSNPVYLKTLQKLNSDYVEIQDRIDHDMLITLIFGIITFISTISVFISLSLLFNKNIDEFN